MERCYFCNESDDKLAAEEASDVFGTSLANDYDDAGDDDAGDDQSGGGGVGFGLFGIGAPSTMPAMVATTDALPTATATQAAPMRTAAAIATAADDAFLLALDNTTAGSADDDRAAAADAAAARRATTVAPSADEEVEWEADHRYSSSWVRRRLETPCRLSAQSRSFTRHSPQS